MLLGGYLMCAFSFFLANVNDGLGPIQSVYLVVSRDYSAGLAGVLWMVREVTSVASAPLVGDCFDRWTRKRLLLGGLVLILSVANVSIMWSDNYGFLLCRAVVAGLTGTSIRPGISSLTLGIVGPTRYAEWAAKTQVSNHLGSVAALGLAGTVAHIHYPDVEGMFVVFGVFGVLGALCVFCIPLGAVDFDDARGLPVERPVDEVEEPSQTRRASVSSVGSDKSEASISGQKSVSYVALIRDPNFVLWAVLVFLHHVSNAAILPLLGIVMGKEGGQDGMIWAASLIVICNIVSTIIASFMKTMTDALGWKGVHYVGWGANMPRVALIVLVMLYGGTNKIALASSQVFDGIGAAVNGVAAMEVTRILTEGTGRFGVSNGAVNMCWGAGAALGNVVFGFVADESYEWAFLTCGLVGLVPLVCLPALRMQSPAQAKSSDSKTVPQEPVPSVEAKVQHHTQQEASQEAPQEIALSSEEPKKAPLEAASDDTALGG
jgi:hypothetical protein